MPHVTRVATVDDGFEVICDDRTVSRYPAELLASKLLRVTVPVELDIEASQLEAVAANALRAGITVDDFIESAIVEKLLRDQ